MPVVSIVAKTILYMPSNLLAERITQPPQPPREIRCAVQAKLTASLYTIKTGKALVKDNLGYFGSMVNICRNFWRERRADFLPSAKVGFCGAKERPNREFFLPSLDKERTSIIRKLPLAA
jgi:hypothetical protein